MDRNGKFHGVRQATIKRFRYLEFLIWFRGWASRKDLMSHFEIGEAAATNDFTAYGKAYPENLNYDVRAKRYTTAKTFIPAFDHDVDHALHALAGNGDISGSRRSELIPSAKPPAIYLINTADIVATITRSIGLRSEMRCNYFSLSQGLQERRLVPVSIASDGARWHFRAFNRENKDFRDYTMARVYSAESSSPGSGADVSIEDDQMWKTAVELELIPHPRAKHPEAIQESFEMSAGVFRVAVRAMLIGYVLRQWLVDVTDDANLPPEAYQLYLKNRETVKETLKLAGATDWALEGLVKLQHQLAAKDI